MNKFYSSFKSVGRLYSFLSTNAFCRTKNLDDAEKKEVKERYIQASVVFSVFLSVLILCAMTFYFIYGFSVHFFFNGHAYSDVKFSSVIFMAAIAISFLLLYVLTRKKGLHGKEAEWAVAIFELFVLFGVFFFFLSDCLDPLTSSSFCAGFLWIVILAVIPCISIWIWLSLIGTAIGGTILVLAFFGSAQPYPFQYYLIIILAAFGSLVLRSILFQTSYYRLAERKQIQENFLISRTDSLTGIENRRGLELFVTNHLPGWKMRGDNVTLVMMDIDYFKQYNDSFGHLAGDECLRAFVRSVVASFPSNSLDFFRYGGDEFIILLNESNPKRIDKFCQMVLKGLSDQKIPASPLAGTPFLTISVGAKSLKVDDSYSFYKHVGLADEMLYKVKNSGRGFAIVNGETIKNE